jgi:hypothetical protein
MTGRTAITERGEVLRLLRGKLAFARRMAGTPDAEALGADRVRMLKVLIEEIEGALHVDDGVTAA